MRRNKLRSLADAVSLGSAGRALATSAPSVVLCPVPSPCVRSIGTAAGSSFVRRAARAGPFIFSTRVNEKKYESCDHRKQRAQRKVNKNCPRDDAHDAEPQV